MYGYSTLPTKKKQNKRANLISGAGILANLGLGYARNSSLNNMLNADDSKDVIDLAKKGDGGYGIGESEKASGIVPTIKSLGSGAVDTVKNIIPDTGMDWLEKGVSGGLGYTTGNLMGDDYSDLEKSLAGGAVAAAAPAVVKWATGNDINWYDAAGDFITGE